jgi:APA family basic amino acid/polyamine antiporter
MDSKHAEFEAGTPRLGLWDAVSLIVGIIIGVGIFRTPAAIFEQAAGPWTALGVWVLGGLLALVGAFCFAELASTYPRSGGEYVYLTRAFGPFIGYLFAWAQLTVIRPGSIAAVAYVFAEYAGALFGADSRGELLLAAAAILLLTAINILGVTLSSATQNILTFVKVLGVLALVGIGFAWGRPEAAPVAVSSSEGSFVTMMIFVLWTYSGWHEAAYVAAEVKDRRRNLPRSLLLATAAVTVIYVLVNAAYLVGLGFAQARSPTLAADLVGLIWPREGERLMALLVSICALGGVNGMIFTTARIYAEFGLDHPLFAPLGRWSRRWGTPVHALVVQGLICLAMTVVLWGWGHEIYASSAQAAALKTSDMFEHMLYLTTAVFWGFFLLTGVALFVLRRKDHDVTRPFPVPLYPLLPAVFCLWCGGMMVGAIQYKPTESLAGMLILCAGLPFYFIPRTRRRRPAVREPVGPPV